MCNVCNMNDCVNECIIQAVLFDLSKYNISQAKDWMDQHNFKYSSMLCINHEGKQGVAEHLIRFRLFDPNFTKYRYTRLHLNDGVILMLQLEYI